ncbi:hypothetical protein [Methylocella silvestris]|uniref:hypothetical protein n=1 Tax=Methylocella silvestris TaxID=199596 RepID=UPI0011AF15E6|nr:hypothetical protein [Methylocella silvestris]
MDFASAEDAAIWTRSWVTIGHVADIPRTGDILPFTVGTHGVHVERLADGGLIGRFNKAQHGGCRSVPVQCQTGAKTKCSFTSCGYSRDRRPIAAGSAEDAKALDQYIGLRPERLLPVAVRTIDGLIAVNLDPRGAEAADWLDQALLPDVASNEDSTQQSVHWLECNADWKLLAYQLAAGTELSSGLDFVRTSILLAGGARATATLLFPNAVIVSANDGHCVIILQPVAIGHTLCRIRVSGAGSETKSPESLLQSWLVEISPRLQQAKASQAAICFDPTDPESDSVQRGPLRHAAEPARWLVSKISEQIQSCSITAPGPFQATAHIGRRS